MTSKTGISKNKNIRTTSNSPETPSEPRIQEELKFDPSKPLEHYIKIAIADCDVEAMYELKDICDKLFNGFEEYKGFRLIPSDQLYEEMLASLRKYSNELDQAIKSNASSCKRVAVKGILNKKPTFKHEARLPDLWMGSIPKHQVIKSISDALIMPKFDGCSCGVKYTRNVEGRFEPTKATTRGTDTSHKKEATDILPKYLTICQDFTDALNRELVSTTPYKFSNGLLLANLKSISFRGEIVAKDKDELTTAAAPYVAGKINGGMEVWNKAVDTICFVPYEIMNVYLDDSTALRLGQHDEEDTQLKPIVKPLSSEIPEYMRVANENEIDQTLIHHTLYAPSQTETIDFLDHINQLSFETFNDVQLKSDDESLTIIRDYFIHFQDTVKQPIDGVVYCSATWRYPQHKSETTDSAYTKYAWKPTSESTTRLKSIEYNIARDGKIGLITKFDPIKMNGKTFKQCKTAPTRINKLYGIGIGSVITIELCKDINPQIRSFEEDDDIKPYTLPTKCPFCKGPVVRTDKKDTVTIKCTNLKCQEQLIQKYKYFMTHIGVKGIAEGKLRKLCPNLHFNNILLNYLQNDIEAVINTLLQITLRSFLMGIGYGTASQIAKATPGINDLALMVDEYDTLQELTNGTHDPFVKDIIDYIDKHCFED